MHMQSPERPRSDISSAWSRVAAFSSAVDANLDRWLVDTYRLGLTEYRALIFIGQTLDKELRVNDLAQRVGLTQSSVTRLVSRLEAKGYARRDVCQDDGRGVYAVITEHGETLAHTVRAPYEDRINKLLTTTTAHFPSMDAAELGYALREIERLLIS